MCIEHKQYWKCCKAVDGKSINPCDRALNNYPCNVEEIYHPNAGRCGQCPNPRTKLHRAATYPPYNSHEQPPSPTKYKVIKSQPIRFPDYCYPQPERGRTRTRTPLPETSLIGPIQVLPQEEPSHFYTEPPQTPPYSDDDNDNNYIYKRQCRSQELQPTNNLCRIGGYKYRFGDIVDLGGPIKYRVASPGEVESLQRRGLLPQW